MFEHELSISHRRPLSPSLLSCTIVVLMALASAPALAKTTVHFASTFNAAGEKINGAWLVGVDCGDGVVQGAGLCADTPADCVSSAIDKVCGVTGTAPGSGSGGTTGGSVGQTGPGTAEVRFDSTFAFVDPRPDPDWFDELAVRSQNLSPASRLKMIGTLRDGLDDMVGGCRYTCYVWGPGCPCWPGDDDVLFRTSPLDSLVSELGAEMLFDLLQCKLQLGIDGTDPDDRERLRACALDCGSGPGQNARWTDWLDRDRPSGQDDFEGLSDFVASGQSCANPLEIECRAKDGRDWRDTGQVYDCSIPAGGICRNSDQTDGRCLDYEVRFRCPV